MISSPNVTLRNTIITGNLLLSEDIGEGDVTLDGVEVRGNTIVKGGGANSIHFNNTVLLTVIVNKNNGAIRIVASGSTRVTEVQLESTVKIQEQGLSEGSTGFENITIKESLQAIDPNAKVELMGDFDTVNSRSTNIRIDLAAETDIATLILNAAAAILGPGRIDTAEINANGSTLSTMPQNVVLDNGVDSVEIDGEDYNDDISNNLDATLTEIHATQSSIDVEFDRIVTGETIADFDIEATLGGEPFTLTNLEYDSSRNRFTYNPIPLTDNIDKELNVSITPKAESQKVRGNKVESAVILKNGFSGRITDVSAIGVAGITVKFREGAGSTSGEIVGEATTDRYGFYSINLAPGTYTGEFVKNGYITSYMVAVAPSDIFNKDQNGTAIRGAASNEVKIMLSWDELPLDIDSHLVGPSADHFGEFHTWYGDKTYRYGDVIYADLDWDDTRSYGPETTTIRKLVNGTYKFYVHNFSQSVDPEATTLRNSGAKIKVFRGNDLNPIKEMVVPVGSGDELYWNAFEMDVSDNGESISIKEINELQDAVNDMDAPYVSRVAAYDNDGNDRLNPGDKISLTFSEDVSEESQSAVASELANARKLGAVETPAVVTWKSNREMEIVLGAGATIEPGQCMTIPRALLFDPQGNRPEEDVFIEIPEQLMISAVEVGNEEELLHALNNLEIRAIELTQNIELQEPLTINRKITIDGMSYTLKSSGYHQIYSDDVVFKNIRLNTGLHVNGNNVLISKVSLGPSLFENPDWKYGIKIEGGTSIIIRECSFVNILGKTSIGIVDTAGSTGTSFKVEDSTFSGGYAGIVTEGATEVKAERNRFVHLMHAIYLDKESVINEGNIYGNTISDPRNLPTEVEGDGISVKSGTPAVVKTWLRDNNSFENIIPGREVVEIGVVPPGYVTSVMKYPDPGKLWIDVHETTLDVMQNALSAKYKDTDGVEKTAEVIVTQKVDENQQPVENSYDVTIVGAIRGVEYTLVLADEIVALKDVNLNVSWEDFSEGAIPITNVYPTQIVGVIIVMAEGTTAEDLAGALSVEYIDAENVLQKAPATVSQVTDESGQPIENRYSVAIKNPTQDVEYMLVLSEGFEALQGVDLGVSWSSEQAGVIHNVKIGEQIGKLKIYTEGISIEALQDGLAVTFTDSDQTEKEAEFSITQAVDEDGLPLPEVYDVTIENAAADVVYTLTFSEEDEIEFSWEAPEEVVVIESVTEEETVGEFKIVATDTTAEALEGALSATYVDVNGQSQPAVVTVTQALDDNSQPIVDTYIAVIENANTGLNYNILLADGFEAIENEDMIVSWESVPEPVISITNVSEESEIGNVRITVAGATTAELEAALTAKDEAGNPVVVAVTQAV
ncbi:pectate lyase-like adhesive domain-containing protein, partial [Brevibacillus sp. SYSU BS000544]|uniref:pectate lyase-like adhesive domain-containing protein n=1 Tax=Brevibacillus sp. SYSU BS000544 TaxID=3416443 RepID=UPI003CE51CDC